MMESLSVVMPVIASVVATILTALIAMMRTDVRLVKEGITKLNGRIADHVENKDLHYAAQARVDQQIANLLQTVKVAHERIDHVEEAVHGKG